MHHNGQKDKQRQTKRIDKRFDDLEESAEVPNERLLRGITNVGWHARNLHSVSSIHFRGDDQESTQDLANLEHSYMVLVMSMAGDRSGDLLAFDLSLETR